MKHARNENERNLDVNEMQMEAIRRKMHLKRQWNEIKNVFRMWFLLG